MATNTRNAGALAPSSAAETATVKAVCFGFFGGMARYRMGRPCLAEAGTGDTRFAAAGPR